jgi:hypothetical protein
MIRADIPEANYGANVQVKVPMPRGATTVSTELNPAAVGQVGPGASGAGMEGERLLMRGGRCGGCRPRSIMLARRR